MVDGKNHQEKKRRAMVDGKNHLTRINLAFCFAWCEVRIFMISYIPDMGLNNYTCLSFAINKSMDKHVTYRDIHYIYKNKIKIRILFIN